MKYASYQYIIPPRAEDRISPGVLGFFEKRGWYAQAKKNGTNCLIFLGPDHFIRVMNRHGGPINRWSPSLELVATLRKRLPKGWNVLNGELLEHKTKTVKGKYYLHDILVYGGEHLIGSTYAHRHSLVMNTFVGRGDTSESTWSHYVLPDGLWIARNIRAEFTKVFKALTAEEDEGLVLKNPEGFLRVGKVDWVVKCRRATKNFGF